MNKEEKQNIFQQVESFCKGKGVVEPVEYLLEIMRGKDPRPGVGTLFVLVKDVPEDELPDEDQWELIRNMVIENPLYWNNPIDSDTSIRAAEKILEYIHPKLKSLEVRGSLALAVKVAPLTEEDVDKFNEWWSGEFA